MQNSSAELFPLSWLAQYGYCPRRCGLLSIDQVWAENAETAAGRSQHERVHTARLERRGGMLFLYELAVFSRKLGISGKCDCIELHPDPNGSQTPWTEGSYRLYPIEYKHGVVRQEEEYHIQLCAQAMCLEEQLGCSIPTGAIFYIDSHRRNEIILDNTLREKTRKTANAVQAMLESQQIPKAQYAPKCKKCSLLEYCQPKAKTSAARYTQKLWISLKEDEP